MWLSPEEWEGKSRCGASVHEGFPVRAIAGAGVPLKRHAQIFSESLPGRYTRVAAGILTPLADTACRELPMGGL